MPMYRRKCLECRKIFDTYARVDDMGKIKCECGGDTKASWEGLRKAGNHVWEPYWEDNITGKPILVESKKHLKELCREHDVYAARLEQIRKEMDMTTATVDKEKVPVKPEKDNKFMLVDMNGNAPIVTYKGNGWCIRDVKMMYPAIVRAYRMLNRENTIYKEIKK